MFTCKHGDDYCRECDIEREAEERARAFRIANGIERPPDWGVRLDVTLDDMPYMTRLPEWMERRMSEAADRLRAVVAKSIAAESSAEPK